MKAEKEKEVFEKIDRLWQLLSERIVDCDDYKGMKQTRHAYIFYRDLLDDIRDTIQNR